MDGTDKAPETTTDQIVVNGYSQRFVAAVADVLKIEGGHVNDRADRGGETNCGISLRFLASEGAFDDDGDGKADFDLDMDGDIDGADIRALTPGAATFLYHRCFWLRLKAETFPRPIGEMMFDQGINAGIATARKLLQRAINRCLMQMPLTRKRAEILSVDGAIGNATQNALREVIEWPALGTASLVIAYRDAAKERYRDIVRRYPDQKRFLNGWLARAERLGR